MEEVFAYLRNEYYGAELIQDQQLAVEKSACRKKDIPITSNYMQHIKDTPARELVAGFTGHYVHGKDMTLGYVEIKAGNDLPQHQHPHEQITYIIDGQLDMIIGGRPYTLTAGMYFVIPSNTPHGAVAVTDCKVIDVFNPVREDYRS